MAPNAKKCFDSHCQWWYRVQIHCGLYTLYGLFEQFCPVLHKVMDVPWTLLLHFSPCKGIRMPESGKFFHVESGIREDFACGIRNPGRDFEIRNSAQGIRSTT